MAELKIRDVPAQVVAVLNEQAKRMGISREAFLRMELERLAVLNSMVEVDAKYQQLTFDLLEYCRTRDQELLELKSLVVETITQTKTLISVIQSAQTEEM